MTNRFKEARLRAGLSQKTAAISLGVRPPSMSDWESGKTKQPATKGELLNDIISRVRVLPDPALARLSDFLDGLEAGQEIASQTQVDQDPAGGAAE